MPRIYEKGNIILQWIKDELFKRGAGINWVSIRKMCLDQLSQKNNQFNNVYLKVKGKIIKFLKEIFVNLDWAMIS